MSGTRSRYFPVACLAALVSTVVLGIGFPALAAENFSGHVRFFIDGEGRAVVLVDSDASGAPDGYVDEAFLLAQETAMNEELDVDLPSARVTFTGDRVLVDASDGSVHVDLAIGNPSPVGGGATVYRIVDGVELVRKYEDGTVLMSGYGTGNIGSGLFDLWLKKSGDGCRAGGEGSSQCSLAGQCSVTCKDGYYACCNGISEGGCTCHRE